MGLTLITSPTQEPLTLEETKVHLKVDEADDDGLIYALIEAARSYCESYQRRVYISQTWELWLDDWPDGDYIALPLPPLQSVTSVIYYDTDDTEATFSSDDYFVDTKNEPGRVHLNYGEVWPTTTLRPANGVVVRFVAGYGSEVSDVPEKAKQAMKLLIGAWYEQREAITASGLNINVVPFAVDALLWQDRIFG